MQTYTKGTYTATLSPTRNTGEFQALLAKCNGAHERPRLKSDKRVYPRFYVGMSTAEYVTDYVDANDTGKYGQQNAKLSDFFGPLNIKPCTLYSGEDTHETIEDETP